jgi:phage-related protein
MASGADKIYLFLYTMAHVGKIAQAVHVFEKRTERTRQGDLELARSRLRQVERARREAGSRAT